MDNLFIAFIMGIVEGLTEFLPVSSSGHLILTGELLDFSGPKAATFEIVIQLGAIMAVVLLYWQRFIGLLKPNPQQRFSGAYGVWLLILTSLPACCFGLLFHSIIKNYLFSTASVLLALVTGALCMLAIDRRQRPAQYATLDQLTPKTALGIGFCQCMALWPGFSRSASTIMGGMIFGCSRGLAAEYSFIAAVPIMVAATGYDLLKNWNLFAKEDFAFFAVGMICAFISAIIAIKFFIRILSKTNLLPFAIYRLALAPVMYYFLF